MGMDFNHQGLQIPTPVPFYQMDLSTAVCLAPTYSFK